MDVTTTALNVFGECQTSNKTLAALLGYAGYPVTKCSTVIGAPTWTFKDVKKFDLEIYENEAKSDSTTVVLQPYLRAIGLMGKVAKISRTNQGLWESRKGWTIFDEVAEEGACQR